MSRSPLVTTVFRDRDERERDEETFAPVLARLSSQSEELFNARPMVFETLQRLDRPASQLLRGRVRGPQGSVGIFVKVSRPEFATPAQVEADYRASLRAHAHLTHGSGLSVARPIACYPELLAVVTEEAPGQTLASLLRRAFTWPPRRAHFEALGSAMERLGRWLAAFHKMDLRKGAVSLPQMRGYLDDRLQSLVKGRRSWFGAAHREAVLRLFDSLASLVPADQLDEVPLHDDFCPDNVLAADDSVHAIDLGSNRGAKLHDLTYLFLYLEVLKSKPLVPTAAVQRLQEALLRGYDPAVHPSQALFQLFVLQHTICELVVQTDPRRKRLSTLYSQFLWGAHLRWIRNLP